MPGPRPPARLLRGEGLFWRFGYKPSPGPRGDPRESNQSSQSQEYAVSRSLFFIPPLRLCGRTEYLFSFFCCKYFLVGEMYFFKQFFFPWRGGERKGNWLPWPMVLVVLNQFCAFEIVLSCLLGGKAYTRRAEEVGEEEEVTRAVILLNTAGCLGGLCSGSSVEGSILEAQYCVLGATTLLPLLS